MNDQIQKTILSIKRPGVVIIPTETVYGLSCSALDEVQINRINEIKNRPTHKSFIVLVDSLAMVNQYVSHLSDLEKELLLSKEPTTVILNNIMHLPASLLAADNSLAFRITKHPMVKEVISNLNHPIVSTSANTSGNPTALLFEDLETSILDQVDYAVNLKSEFKSTLKPSRIVKVVGGKVEIIRS